MGRKGVCRAGRAYEAIEIVYETAGMASQVVEMASDVYD